MLDESQIGKVDSEQLKCELCGLYYDSEDDADDYASVEVNSRCLSCYEEYRDDLFPDR